MSVNYYTKISMRFQHFMLFFWKLGQTGREICLKKTGMIRQDHARLSVSKGGYGHYLSVALTHRSLCSRPFVRVMSPIFDLITLTF